MYKLSFLLLFVVLHFECNFDLTVILHLNLSFLFRFYCLYYFISQFNLSRFDRKQF